MTDADVQRCDLMENLQGRTFLQQSGQLFPGTTLVVRGHALYFGDNRGSECELAR